MLRTRQFSAYATTGTRSAASTNVSDEQSRLQPAAPLFFRRSPKVADARATAGARTAGRSPISSSVRARIVDDRIDIAFRRGWQGQTITSI